MKYEIGGKVIAVRHGTDHSYEDWFRVIAIQHDRLELERWSSTERGHYVELTAFEKDHINYIAPYNLDEDLFTL